MCYHDPYYIERVFNYLIYNKEKKLHLQNCQIASFIDANRFPLSCKV